MRLMCGLPFSHWLKSNIAFVNHWLKVRAVDLPLLSQPGYNIPCVAMWRKAVLLISLSLRSLVCLHERYEQSGRQNGPE